MNLYNLTRTPRPDMAWPVPGPAPLWPPPEEEGWYRLEESEFGHHIKAFTLGGSISFRTADSSYLREGDSGKLELRGGGGRSGPEYTTKLLGCFAAPSGMLRSLPIAGATVVAVGDLYGGLTCARIDAAPGAVDAPGTPYRRISVPTGRPEAERAAWEATVEDWRAAYERAIREAFAAWDSSEAAKVAKKEVAEAVERSRHPASASAPWYCFGTTAAEVVAAHPALSCGIGVSPNTQENGYRTELVQGDRALLALVASRGMSGKRHSFRVNPERSVGVRLLVDNSTRRDVRIVAAVEPGWTLVAESYTDGNLNWSCAWDASGEREVPLAVAPAPEKAADLGTFADILRK